MWLELQNVFAPRRGAVTVHPKHLVCVVIRDAHLRREPVLPGQDDGDDAVGGPHLQAPHADRGGGPPPAGGAVPPHGGHQPHL